MHKAVLRIPEILRQLESLYGPQAPLLANRPVPFSGLVALRISSERCGLRERVGVAERRGRRRAASTARGRATRLARALKPGGMVPELRAMRLMAIAARIQDEN